MKSIAHLPVILPSRATAPERCAECDDDRDLPGPLCSECVHMSLLQRVSDRYQNGEGIVPWSDNERWRAGRKFDPLSWELGAGLEFDHCGAAAWIHLGPCTFYVGWSL